MANKMANCPNSVAGASSVLEVVDGALSMTVTHTDAAGTGEIRKRAQHLQSVDSAAASAAHSGKGTGGNAAGKCPAALADTTLEVKEIEGGVAMILRSSKGASGEALKTQASDRIMAMSDHSGHGSQGKGGGVGGHGGDGTGEGSGTGHKADHADDGHAHDEGSDDT